ncbi:MAG: FAD-dependent oxidoreductase, partial [Gemmatimonadaceae bacterium]
MSSAPVVVIGAGINGLVAAHYLRRAGHNVTLLERAERAGGACVRAEATVDGRTQSYSLGASVLGLMPDFIFQETGLAERLETFVPSTAKRVYFPTPEASAWIHRDPAQLDEEFRRQWGEHGDAAAFRADEARVVEFLQSGYRSATPPNLDAARLVLGDTLTRLWITGSAWDLLTHYFTADRTQIYMAMTVTESGPVSLREPYSSFTLPLMDSGSVFDGYYGFVKPGLWRLTEVLAEINREIGVQLQLGAQVEEVDPYQGRLRYRAGGATHHVSFEHLVLATDPLSAARLVGDHATTEAIAGQRFLGSSGKLTLFFRHPVRWKDAPDADADAAFRFVFSVETLEAFERATTGVRSGDTVYQPGFVQVYCEGAAMRRLGLNEPYDRLTLFFKNLALGTRGDALDDVKQQVMAQVLSH